MKNKKQKMSRTAAESERIMPNYCNNSLVVTGSEQTLKKIIEAVKTDESDFDFNTIIPMPDYIYTGNLGPEERALYGDNNWYDWSTKNWGTKWNSCDVILDEYDNELDFSFLTAWSPCIPVIEKFANIYADTKVFYEFDEGGSGFCGKREYENGKLVLLVDADYCENYECEDVPKEELDFFITDELYPIQEEGSYLDATDTIKIGGAEVGNLHYREYCNGSIKIKIDGRYYDARKNKSFLWDPCEQPMSKSADFVSAERGGEHCA